MTALWQLAIAVAICMAVFVAFTKAESYRDHHPRGRYRQGR